MSVRTHLEPFPAAAVVSSSTNIAVSGNVNDLRDWVWKWKKLNVAFALTFDDGAGGGPVALSIPDLEIEMGVNDTDGPFASQKDVLDYRLTRYVQSGTGWTYTIQLGSTMFYGPVRDGGGALITSGGSYEYEVHFRLEATTVDGSGLISTDSGDGASTVTTTFDFLGTGVQLYEDGSLDGTFAGTVTISGLESW